MALPPLFIGFAMMAMLFAFRHKKAVSRRDGQENNAILILACLAMQAISHSLKWRTYRYASKIFALDKRLLLELDIGYAAFHNRNRQPASLIVLRHLRNRLPHGMGP